MSNEELSARVTTLEAEIVEIKRELEYSRNLAKVEKGIAQMHRGEGILARVAFEKMRKKYKDRHEMSYKVTLSVEANEDLEAAYEWLAEKTPFHGPAWYNGLVDAVLSLENHPERCPLAPENKDSSVITRHLIYGKRQHAYRIVFTIRDEVVWVVTIVHGARDARG